MTDNQEHLATAVRSQGGRGLFGLFTRSSVAEAAADDPVVPDAYAPTHRGEPPVGEPDVEPVGRHRAVV